MKKLAAITGASSGIGETFARKLAPKYNLLLIARRQDKLEQLASDLTSRYGAQVEVMTADLTMEEDTARVSARLAADTSLGLLVNNAGFGARGRFWQAAVEDQERMHKLHVMATVRLTHAALRNMVGRDDGAIINVASVSAFVRTPGTASYSATKSWMTSFTEALYVELEHARSNVTVQALCPGFTYSEFHDKMGVSRNRLASKPFWMSAEKVVDASLEGLNRRKLFVVPGWQYSLLTAFLTKIPTRLRLFIETNSLRRQIQPLNSGGDAGLSGKLPGSPA